MAKSETARLDKYVLRWMSDMGERIGAERVGDALSGAMLGVVRTKAAVDRNVASLLAMANIPSRAEYQRMMTRVDVLQNRIIDLNRRLDAISHDLAGANGRRGRKKDDAKPTGSRLATVDARARRGRTTSSARKRRR
jgi:RNA 3'-terminal phosphate cyclase